MGFPDCSLVVTRISAQNEVPHLAPRSLMVVEWLAAKGLRFASVGCCIVTVPNQHAFGTRWGEYPWPVWHWFRRKMMSNPFLLGVPHFGITCCCWWCCCCCCCCCRQIFVTTYFPIAPKKSSNHLRRSCLNHPNPSFSGHPLSRMYWCRKHGKYQCKDRRLPRVPTWLA